MKVFCFQATDFENISSPVMQPVRHIKIKCCGRRRPTGSKTFSGVLLESLVTDLDRGAVMDSCRHRSRLFWSAIEIQTETLLVRPRALSFPSGSSYYNALQFSSGFFFSDVLDQSHFSG